MLMQGRWFFLAAPELSRMSVEYRRQLDSLIWKWSVRPSEVTREHSAVNKIKNVIIDHGNPFAVQGDRLHNMTTHACVPGEFWNRYVMQTTLARRCMKTMLLYAPTGILTIGQK